MAYSIAWVGTLAFVGWVLWLRERRGETVTERIADIDSRLAAYEATGKARDELLSSHAAAIVATRDIVDNLQLKSGMSLKR